MVNGSWVGDAEGGFMRRRIYGRGLGGEGEGEGVGEKRVHARVTNTQDGEMK